MVVISASQPSQGVFLLVFHTLVQSSLLSKLVLTVNLVVSFLLGTRLSPQKLKVVFSGRENPLNDTSEVASTYAPEVT